MAAQLVKRGMKLEPLILDNTDVVFDIVGAVFFAGRARASRSTSSLTTTAVAFRSSSVIPLRFMYRAMSWDRPSPRSKCTLRPIAAVGHQGDNLDQSLDRSSFSLPSSPKTLATTR